MRPRRVFLVVAVTLCLCALSCLVEGKAATLPLPREIRSPHDKMTRPRAAGEPSLSRPAAVTKTSQARLAAARSTSSDSESSARTVPAGALDNSPIRISMVNLIESDASDRVCTNVDDDVRIGTPPSNSDRCGEGVTFNCWTTCTAEDVVTPQKIAAITDTIAVYAQTRMQDTLSVFNPLESLVLSDANGEACGDASTYGAADIPSSYFSNGVSDTDLIIFLTARPTRGQEVAYGFECQSDATTARPVAGRINVAPAYVDPSDTTMVQWAVLRELVHILGFSSSKQADYRADGGVVYDDSDAETPVPFMVSVTYEAGNTVSLAGSPRVRAVARQHFDCAALLGVELEDGGGANVRLSNWEQRVLGNELMTGTLSVVPEPALSYFTLALFEDMGWYVADYTMADPLSYGYHEGCAFVTAQCSTWDSEYFCTEDDSVGCTFDRSGKGACTLSTWSSIPPYFQYFESPFVGGYSSLADFCAIYVGGETGSCANSANAAYYSEATDNLEVYSSTSKCFSANVKASGATFDNIEEPRCYEMSCDDSSGTKILTITVNGVALTCPVRGGTVTDSSFQGYVVCPPVEEVCFTPRIVAPPAPIGSASLASASALLVLALTLLAM